MVDQNSSEANSFVGSPKMAVNFQTDLLAPEFKLLQQPGNFGEHQTNSTKGSTNIGGSNPSTIFKGKTANAQRQRSDGRGSSAATDGPAGIKSKRETENQKDDGPRQARSYFSCKFHDDNLKGMNDDREHDKTQTSPKKKGCPVCKAQINEGDKFAKKRVRKEEYYIGEELSFVKLIKSMIPDTNDPKEKMIKGCQVFFPETVFFSKSKIDFIAANDKDMCLSFQNYDSKQNKLLDLRKKLPEIVKERRNPNIPDFNLQLQANERNKPKVDGAQSADGTGQSTAGGANQTKDEKSGGKKAQGSKTETNRLMQQLKSKEDPAIQQESKRDQYYTEAAIIRFRPENDPEYEDKNESRGLGNTATANSQAKMMAASYGQNPNAADGPTFGGNDENDEVSDEAKIGFVQVVNEKILLSYFERSGRSYEAFWRSILYIQTCINYQKGIGESIDVHFWAPLDESSEDASKCEVDYDFKSFGDELTLLQTGEYQKYAAMQCMKICYYLQNVRSIEILQMKAEFLMDANKNIWFTYAKEIVFRKMENRMAIQEFDSKKGQDTLQAHQAAQKDMLLKELEEYENSSNQQRKKDNYVKSKMLEFMEEYYQKMKQDMGIEANYGIEEEDPKLEVVLRTLRPNTTAKNFKDFLAKSQNVFKDQKWRAISRKVHKDDEKEQMKVGHTGQGQMQNFFSARQSNQQAPINGLLSALETVNKEAINSGMGGGTHGPASRVLNGINAIRSAADNNHMMLSDKYSDRVVAQGSRQISNLKAELVRNKLVTRTDLMKLYQPPLKKSQLPTNNPFFTKSLIKQPSGGTSQVGPYGGNDSQSYASNVDLQPQGSISSNINQYYSINGRNKAHYASGTHKASHFGSSSGGPTSSARQSATAPSAASRQKGGKGRDNGKKMMNWQVYQHNKHVLDKINRRMKYLKSTDENIANEM